MVTWTITNVGGANAQGNACMQITYTFSDRGAATAAFMQEMNRRDGAAGKVGLSCSLAGNVSGNSITVNCVRADANAGWSYSYSMLVTMFH